MPVTAVPVKSPLPPRSSARAETFASTVSIVTSPPNSVMPVISADAEASAVECVTADPLSVIAPLERIEASAGYVKPAWRPVESFGAETYPPVTGSWPGTSMRIPKACDVAMLSLSADVPVPDPMSRTDAPRTSATSGSTQRFTRLPLCVSGFTTPRETSAFRESLARELAKTRPRVVVGAEPLVGRVPRVGGDLLGHRVHLPRQRVVVRVVPEQRVDPGLGPVVGRHVVVEQELAEQDADADVGEGAEREHPVRRRDERVDLGVRVLDLGDDRADGLVDERNPDLFGSRHEPQV